MRLQRQNDHKQTEKNAFGHAIVIGSSIAGLATARVLTDHFDRVTIIDRDHLPDTPQMRRCIPQARHAHTLPMRGQLLLEEMFPGLSDELLDQGAISIAGGSEMGFYIAGGWHQLRHQSAVISMSYSRPLLESTIYRRLARHPKVQVLEGYDVVGLCTDFWGRQATGVHLKNRQTKNDDPTTLQANLIVDASGRDSQAPTWLASLGFEPPRESVINAHTGYASRIYKRSNDMKASWKTLYIRPTPKEGTRGGVIVPIEGDRWIVTLVGMARDYPPTDKTGFLAFAKSLPTPELYDAIKDAEPLTKPCGYRRTENRVRHYDRLPRYLEGFLVCGDAAYVLNPAYAQGMTSALLGSQALDQSLQAQRAEETLEGLAEAFQAQLTEAVAEPWKLALREDKRWPATDVSENMAPVRRQVIHSISRDTKQIHLLVQRAHIDRARALRLYLVKTKRWIRRLNRSFEHRQSQQVTG